VIAALTQKAESVRAAELERLLARCPDLSEREKMLVAGMSMTIVSKLLHSAVNKLREKALAENAEALPDAQLLEELFELHPTVER
jgi:glutamyl-tRNA reductase